MVWSTTQSALYNDLSRYYEDDRPRKKGEAPELCELFNEERGDKSCEKITEKNGGDRSPKRGSGLTDECGKKCRNDCAEKNHPPCPNCPCTRQAPGSQISRLISDKFSDKDMLLIAGLIFLLIKQGADKKLILALAFVLLS